MKTDSRANASDKVSVKVVRECDACIRVNAENNPLLFSIRKGDFVQFVNTGEVCEVREVVTSPGPSLPLSPILVLKGSRFIEPSEQLRKVCQKCFAPIMELSNGTNVPD